jgi:hypothetical protein
MAAFFWVFFTLFRKILTITSLTVSFWNLDTGLGAIFTGAKVTLLGANENGAKTLHHVDDEVDVAAPWHHQLWHQAHGAKTLFK